MEAPTVAAFAARLDTGGEQDPLDVLLPLRPSGDRGPLFCIHPGAGIGWTYSGLLRYVPAEHPVYALQARGLARPDDLPGSMAELAGDYLEQIRSVQPHGPYHLLGWSFGGIVAHLIATELQRQGEEVALLSLLDVYPLREEDRDGAPRPEVPQDPAERTAGVLAALLQFLGFDPSGFGDRLLTYGDVMDVLRRGDSALAWLEERHIAALADIGENFGRILPGARLGTFDGDALVFVAAEGKEKPEAMAADWQPYVTGRVVGHLVDCAHDGMTRPEPIAVIGEVLASRLRDRG
ncbi:alpha/beta fold hydrolase [Kitasatospora sp. NA04385]|nr:alpha/beta fold hydrolase [Kitasatospora sp. NA04385]